MNFTNKTALITGASRGIGLALAEAAAKRKMHLHLASRTLPADLEQQLKAKGALSVHLWPADLTKSSAVDQLVQQVYQKTKQVDVLINNAGLLTGGLLEEQDPDAIEKMLMVNVHAVIRLTRLILPKMLEAKTGVIVNNASVSGKMFFPCASTYAASKAAVVAFTESLKQELRNTGVSTRLLITPGVKTDMYDDISKLYGSHLDMSILTSIPAEQWAEHVWNGIENETDTIWPVGRSRFGVFLGHHFPGVFESMIKSKFSRQ